MSTFDAIVAANKLIKTTDIKGKDYAEVNQRVKAFRSVHPDGAIITEILSLENGVCTMKATVLDKDGNILGTGHAQEKENSTFINKTSFIENCESSAWGRALGACGFGIDTSIASAEEVMNAMANQDEPDKPKKTTKATTKKTKTDNLSEQKAELVELCSEIVKDESKREAVYAAVIANNTQGKKNPNAIKTIEEYEKMKAALLELKDD